MKVGFVIAGVGVGIGIVGSALYCVFGIGCAPDPPTDEGNTQSAREGQPQLDEEGNPVPLEDIEEVHHTDKTESFEA